MNHLLKRFHILKSAVILAGLAVFIYGAAIITGCTGNNGHNTSGEGDQVILRDPVPSPSVLPITGNFTGDWTRFEHTDPAHSRLPCLLCHTREDNSTRLAFPGRNAHAPCAGCHVEQFENTGSKICTICHTDPQAGEMKGFPPLRTFTTKFNHAKHVGQASCATCHQPSRGGVAQTVPSGTAAHASCFQCHTNTSPLGMCSTCHTEGPPVRNTDKAVAYNLSFSHRDHARNLSCSACHTVVAGSVRGRQVTAPRPAMHFASGGQSCATCHNDKRAFGATDFANCKRCHVGDSFGFRRR